MLKDMTQDHQVELGVAGNLDGVSVSFESPPDCRSIPQVSHPALASASSMPPSPHPMSSTDAPRPGARTFSSEAIGAKRSASRARDTRTGRSD